MPGHALESADIISGEISEVVTATQVISPFYIVMLSFPQRAHGDTTCCYHFHASSAKSWLVISIILLLSDIPPKRRTRCTPIKVIVDIM